MPMAACVRMPTSGIAEMAGLYGRIHVYTLTMPNHQHSMHFDTQLSVVYEGKRLHLDELQQQ